MTPTLRSAWTVASFEARRSLTWARGALWLVLAGFPACIVAIANVSMNTNRPPPNVEFIWQVVIFVLTQVTVALSVLLWASPALQVELENRTWIYSATRPYGRRAVLLGRYAVAILWAATANVVGVTACCLITGISHAIPALLAATILSCFAFASLFSLIAVMLPKRAMSIAFALSLLLELGITFIPAMIHNLSIEYHLRCLLSKWQWHEYPPAQSAAMLFSEWPASLHVTALLFYSVVLLWAAVLVLESREMPTDDI